MLEKQRFAWNECSKVKFNIPANSIILLHGQFYTKFRQSQPEIPSQVVISAEQSVLSAYRSIKSNKQKLEKPPEKKKLSIRLDKRTYSYKNGVFSIISLEKRVKCSPYIYPKLQELISKYRFCDPLLFEKNDEIWICLTFDIPEILSQKKLALGIDLGCRVNAATSEGVPTSYRDDRTRYPISVLKFNRDILTSNIHPTQKPLALCEYLVKTYTNDNALVLDNTTGSGTVCLAAKNLNRQFIGIEKEEKYFNIAKERLNLC